ncbi:MAG: dihydroneopterin aldolase [Sphingomonadales bacterium]|jgi:dihydroneopterin aldolase
MTVAEPNIIGLVPPALAPRTRRITLTGLELPVDIGFHEFEIGSPQRLTITIDVWVDAGHFPRNDVVAEAWDYDFLRASVIEFVSGRRFNLQETVVHAIYDLVAARAGVKALRVSSAKPDVYPDCAAVGVELSSF